MLTELLNGIAGLLFGTICALAAAMAARTFSEQETGKGGGYLFLFLFMVVLSMVCYIKGITILVVSALIDSKVL